MPHADQLACRGFWVVCADEMPNRQVLERVPIRRGKPGSIEQQEFDYLSITHNLAAQFKA
jgi:hypothetical protein